MTWTLLSTAKDIARPSARYGHGFASVGDTIYVHGGRNEYGNKNAKCSGYIHAWTGMHAFIHTMTHVRTHALTHPHKNTPWHPATHTHTHTHPLTQSNSPTHPTTDIRLIESTHTRKRSGMHKQTNNQSSKKSSLSSESSAWIAKEFLYLEIHHNLDKLYFIVLVLDLTFIEH